MSNTLKSRRIDQLLGGVDVALTWAVIGSQQRTKHIEP